MSNSLTALELARSIRQKEISCREAAEACLNAVEQKDGELGAFLSVDRDLTLAQADEAQVLIDAGTGGPLTGVPVACKDNLCTHTLPTTCASKILEGYKSPFQATAVERLREAGMVVLGKTNMDEFAMGTSTETSAYQLTKNPWDLACSPGGSSGGSAASVAAHMAPLSLGSDTGGSIRQPASLCGIVGFKPTYGRVSRWGLVAFASSLDQIGPFARTVEDAAEFASVISGHDPQDSTSLPDSKINTADLKSGSIKGLKIGIPEELTSDAIQPEVRASIDEAIKILEAEGAQIHRLSMPSIKLGVTTYYIIAPSEASSNLARFDGIRFGPRIEEGDHNESTAATRGQLFGHEVKLRIMVGTYALSAGYYDAYYLRAQQVRGLMADEFEKAYQDVDLIMSPTSPTVAFKLGELLGDPLALKMLDLCTIPANMGGFPSISIPCSLANGLPVGLCLNGPVMGDEKLLQAAYSIEQALPRVGAAPHAVGHAS